MFLLLFFFLQSILESCSPRHRDRGRCASVCASPAKQQRKLCCVSLRSSWLGGKCARLFRLLIGTFTVILSKGKVLSTLRHLLAQHCHCASAVQLYSVPGASGPGPVIMVIEAATLGSSAELTTAPNNITSERCDWRLPFPNFRNIFSSRPASFRPPTVGADCRLVSSSLGQCNQQGRNYSSAAEASSVQENLQSSTANLCLSAAYPSFSLLSAVVAQPQWTPNEALILIMSAAGGPNDTSYRTFYTGRNLSPQPVLTIHYQQRM